MFDLFHKIIYAFACFEIYSRQQKKSLVLYDKTTLRPFVHLFTLKKRGCSLRLEVWHLDLEYSLQ